MFRSNVLPLIFSFDGLMNIPVCGSCYTDDVILINLKWTLHKRMLCECDFSGTKCTCIYCIRTAYSLRILYEIGLSQLLGILLISSHKRKRSMTFEAASFHIKTRGSKK